jgi:hypothetical protein
MIALAGVFLIAHGLVHGAVWLAPHPQDTPFDPCKSWLLGPIGPLARALAGAAGLGFVVVGTVTLADGGAAAGAAAAALVSLLLVALTFNRWLSGAVAINVAIAVIALL